MTSLAQSFTSALGAKRLLQPANDSAKAHLLALINTDAASPVVASARQGLGNAYLDEATHGARAQRRHDRRHLAHRGAHHRFRG